MTPDVARSLGALFPMFAVVSFLAGTMLAFAVRCATLGRPRTPAIEARPPTPLAKWAQEWWVWVLGPVERAAVSLGISPNAITIASTVVAAAAAWAIAAGSLSLGGWLYLFGASLDIVDGRVARATGRVTRAGAFLDSTLDRVAELLVFAALAIRFRDGPVLYAALAAAISSVLVSYARARGEGLGIQGEAKVGGMQRPERVVVTGLACAMAAAADALAGAGAARTLVGAALTLLAAGAGVTAVRRTASIFRALQASEAARPAPAARLAGVRVLRLGRRHDVVR